MPLTPLHTLALLWIYLRYPRLVDPSALIVSTLIIDIESVVGIILHRSHGIWHSYVGAALVALLMAVLLYMFERRNERLLNRIYTSLQLPFFPPYKLRNVTFTVLLGSTSHVLLDSFTHRSFPNVLFPFEASPNPFWFGFEFAWLVYAVVISLSAYSLLTWFRWSDKGAPIQRQQEL